ncbi:MAG: hypothetical protein H6662_10420 [Ardenticatenaceae bacterium]|nr:hypothetical protein [Anaerolineales bacterium]MCB8921988.1 hypothetical protein [Ardenticatenaceae bacterium]MCB8989564.1 hypothetical protein [Ardenticatenaceae bacterium]MCB9003107.1 hypothetical protein [Ardenticatenaceae bacterium]
MAVSKKGRRKVNYKGREYLWYVQEATQKLPDESGFVEPVKERYLRIFDTKKQFIIAYRIPEPRDAFALLKIEGIQFPRQPGARQLEMPRWKHDSKRYPTADFVRRLIDWCMTPTNE